MFNIAIYVIRVLLSTIYVMIVSRFVGLFSHMRQWPKLSGSSKWTIIYLIKVKSHLGNEHQYFVLLNVTMDYASSRLSNSYQRVHLIHVVTIADWINVYGLLFNLSCNEDWYVQAVSS